MVLDVRERLCYHQKANVRSLGAGDGHFEGAFSREGHFNTRWIKELRKLYSVENVADSDG